MIRFFLSMLLLILATIACGGGSNDLSGCMKVTVDAISTGITIVDVYGTVQNTCSENARYAKVVATCYDSSGTVIGRDEEYIKNLGTGKSKSFNALISNQNQSISRCSAVVEEAKEPHI